jgi:DNA mismatch endonuclease (patch repair protein)
MTKTEWWLNKIGRNKQLDLESIEKLKKDNWKVIVLFECELKTKNINSTLENVVKQLKSQQ